MAAITDGGRFGWEPDGKRFDGVREADSLPHRWGPSDRAKPTVTRVTRTVGDGEPVYIGLVGQEVTGRWVYVLPGRESTAGGASTESWPTRIEAIDCLSVRVTESGTILNSH